MIYRSNMSENPQIAIVAMSREAALVARKVGDALGAEVHAVARFANAAPRLSVVRGSLSDWAAARWSCRALVFVGATEHAVRAIAPSLRTGEDHPIVLVVDEDAQVATPLIAGDPDETANFARNVAAIVGAVPAVAGVSMLGDWAAKHGCAVENPEEAAAVDEAAIAGNAAVVVTELTVPAPLGGPTLWLRPRTLVVGLGCQSHVDAAELSGALRELFEVEHLSPASVGAIAVVDSRATEPAVAALSDELGVPVLPFSASELAGLDGRLSEVEYLGSLDAADPICERAALLGTLRRLDEAEESHRRRAGLRGAKPQARSATDGSRAKPRLLVPYTSYRGFSIAVARGPIRGFIPMPVPRSGAAVSGEVCDAELGLDSGEAEAVEAPQAEGDVQLAIDVEQAMRPGTNAFDLGFGSVAALAREAGIPLDEGVACFEVRGGKADETTLSRIARTALAGVSLILIAVPDEAEENAEAPVLTGLASIGRAISQHSGPRTACYWIAQEEDGAWVYGPCALSSVTRGDAIAPCDVSLRALVVSAPTTRVVNGEIEARRTSASSVRAMHG